MEFITWKTTNGHRELVVVLTVGGGVGLGIVDGLFEVPDGIRDIAPGGVEPVEEVCGVVRRIELVHVGDGIEVEVVAGAVVGDAHHPHDVVHEVEVVGIGLKTRGEEGDEVLAGSDLAGDS